MRTFIAQPHRLSAPGPPRRLRLAGGYRVKAEGRSALPLIALLLVGSSASAAVGVEAFASRPAAEIKLRVSLVEARDSAPDPLHGQLDLRWRSVRAPNFEFIATGASGPEFALPVGPGHTYVGSLKEDPGSRAAATLTPDGWRGVILTGDGRTWRFGATDAGPTSAAPASPAAESQLRAHLQTELRNPIEDLKMAKFSHQSDLPTEPSGLPAECGVVQAELALDCSYSCFEFKGQDLDRVLAFFESTINELNLIYVRDVRIEYTLGRAVVRTSPDDDPYYGLDFWDKLDVVRDEWKTGQWGSSHDQAALVDGDARGSGLAWVGTVCTESRYSINSFSGETVIGVMRHELGHNWGCSHYEGGSPEGPTIMSGNSIARFSGPEKDKIMAHRATRDCLVDLGDYPEPIPPYAHFDDYKVGTCETVVLEVLENDEDANCDALRIEDWVRNTPLGSVVRRQGDALLYVASSEPGLDEFTYTIADSDDRTAVGNIRVSLESAAPGIPKAQMAVVRVDSEQGDTPAENAIDDDPRTIWYTKWRPIADPLPHEIVLDLGDEGRVWGFDYLPRQDGSPYGQIADYELSLSRDDITWGAPVATGTWIKGLAKKSLRFDGQRARFVRLVALSEVDGNPWTSAAELTVHADLLQVSTDPAVRGQNALVGVRGARPGERVDLVVGRNGIGCGPCPDLLGGRCLDVARPARSLGSAEANDAGEAEFQVLVPDDLPDESIAIQAVIRRGPGGRDSVASAAINVMIVDPSPTAAPGLHGWPPPQ